MTTTTPRTRDDVLAELTAERHRAGRMTVNHPDYGPLHERIDELLDELAGLTT